MSEISNQIHCNELRTLTEEELLKVLETVETRILFRAVWNEIERLQKLEKNMQKLFDR